MYQNIHQYTSLIDGHCSALLGHTLLKSEQISTSHRENPNQKFLKKVLMTSEYFNRINFREIKFREVKNSRNSLDLISRMSNSKISSGFNFANGRVKGKKNDHCKF